MTTATPSANPSTSKKTPWIIIVVGIVLGACVLCGIVAVLANSGSGTSSEGRAVAVRDTSTPRPTATPLPISDLVCLEMRELLKGATNAQKDAYYKQWTGQRVLWTGYITEVTKEGVVRVDMDPPGGFSSSDVSLKIPVEDALKYNLKQKITFEATIEKITEIMGSFTFYLKDTIILE